MSSINFDSVVPFESIKGDDDEETEFLIKDAHTCKKYIQCQRWCEEIVEYYFGDGIGKIYSVCLFKCKMRDQSLFEWVWGITGDIPSAYINAEEGNEIFAPNPAIALDCYIGAMMHWVEAAKKGEPVDDLIPVNVPPTLEWAKVLENKLEYLYKEVLQVEYPDEIMQNLGERNSGSYFFQ